MIYPKNENPDAEPDGVNLGEMDEENAFWLQTLRRQREQKKKEALMKLKEKEAQEQADKIKQDADQLNNDEKPKKIVKE